MKVPQAKTIVLVASAALLAGGFFLLGHATADTGTARARGYQSGHNDGYFDGLSAGEAQGRQEGRALQAASAAPSGSSQPIQDAFNSGYAAGVNDAFGGFDGGWALTEPYLVTIEPGSGQVVYRIATRTLLQPDTSYYLCTATGRICHEPRH